MHLERETNSRHPSPVGRRLLLLLFAASMLWGAGPAVAERRCELPAEVTGRTCSVAVCLSLQAAVNNNCKNQQIFSCRRLSQCAALIEMRRRWVSCGQARDTINGTCWRGGDTEHQQKSLEAWQNVGNCNARIADKCDDCPWDDILGFAAARSPEAENSGAAPGGEDPLMGFIERLAAEGKLIEALRESSPVVERSNRDGATED